MWTLGEAYIYDSAMALSRGGAEDRLPCFLELGSWALMEYLGVMNGQGIRF